MRVQSSPGVTDRGMRRRPALERGLVWVLLVVLAASCVGTPSHAPSVAAGASPDASNGGRARSSEPAAPVGGAGVPGPGSTSPAQPDAQPGAEPAGSAIVSGTVNRTSINLVATYDASVQLGFDARTLRVDVVIRVTNRSGVGVDRVELNTITGPLGSLRLGQVDVDGTPVRATVDDQTIRVPLGGILPNGATASVRVRLSATLPSTLGGSNWMFTRYGRILQADRWLPWVGLHRPFERPNHGDPFFTALSPFVRVRITTDRPLVIAAPGRRVSGSGLTQTFEAENVRDFPIVASPGFTIRERRVGDWTVRAFVRDGFPTETVIDQAADALTRMDTLAGDYPYRTLTIAQTAGGYALEGPGMIWIPTGMAGSNLRWNVYHEVAHQWFYGIVGSDHAFDPFADEAVATHLGQVASGIWRTTSCPMRRLDLSIYAYSEACYFGQIYLHGANLLRRIRTEMEPGAYFAAVREYVRNHYFRIGSTRRFLDTLQANTSRNLEPILAPWFPELY